MECTKFQQLLFDEADPEYGDFQVKLAPGILRENVIGVRLPQLRAIAKKCAKEPDVDLFLNDLPHRYFDENMLHSCILTEMKDYETVTACIDAFLPYVDNWAVCDTLLPKVYKKRIYREQLLQKSEEWMSSEHEYTCRYGVGAIMRYFLDEDFKPEHLDKPASIVSDKYYINMMIAWMYATALAKQWDATIPYLTGNVLPKWVHNKTIQKARESFRITPEQKEYLKSLKR